MGAAILLVEDDRMISDIVLYNLEKEGHAVTCASDGAEGLSLALSGGFDLLMLDVMLPEVDGFEICRRVRETSTVPIIMLTAREDEADKVNGLDLGADDYITKPFSMRELISRVNASLRRRQMTSSGTDSAHIDFDGLTISPESYTVIKNGRTLELSVRDYDILRFLSSQPLKIFTREELMQHIWGYDYYGDDLRAVDVAIRRLREKIEDDPAVPRYIMTKRGVGYYFADKQG